MSAPEINPPSAETRPKTASWGRDINHGLDSAARQLRDLLSDLDVASLKEKLTGEVRDYVRLLEVLARLNEARLQYERDRARETDEKREGNARENAAASSEGMAPEVLNQIEHELNLF